MSFPFIGEIRMFGGNFAPDGWAFCSGQLMLIADNDALFALIGTTYGGDGLTTFALPDLRSRIPVHMGQGSGLSTRILAETGGTETETLTINHIPLHSHPARCHSASGTQASPANGASALSTLNQFSSSVANADMNAAAITSAGGDQPHDNLMPFLAVSFIISLFGIFPSP